MTDNADGCFLYVPGCFPLFLAGLIIVDLIRSAISRCLFATSYIPEHDRFAT